MGNVFLHAAGDVLAVTANKAINLLAVENGEPHLEKRLEFGLQTDENLRTFAYINDRRQLAIGRKNGLVQFYGIDTGELEKTISLPFSDNYFLGWSVDMMALSPDQKWLTIGQTWYTTYPINLEDYSVKEIHIPAQPLDMQYSPDSGFIGVLHGEAGGKGLVVYRQAKTAEWTKLIDEWNVDAFGFSADSTKIYYLRTNANHLYELNCRSMKEGFHVLWTLTIPLHSNGSDHFYPAAIRLNANQFFLSLDDVLLELDPSNGEIVHSRKMPAHIHDMIFRKGELWLATGNEIIALKKYSL